MSFFILKCMQGNILPSLKTQKSIKELPEHFLHKRNRCSPPPEAAHSVSAIIRVAEFKFDCVTVCGWSYGLTPCSYSTLHTLTLQWAHKILQFLSHPLQTATKKRRNLECMQKWCSWLASRASAYSVQRQSLWSHENANLYIGKEHIQTLIRRLAWLWLFQ